MLQWSTNKSPGPSVRKRSGWVWGEVVGDKITYWCSSLPTALEVWKKALEHKTSPGSSSQICVIQTIFLSSAELIEHIYCPDCHWDDLILMQTQNKASSSSSKSKERMAVSCSRAALESLVQNRIPKDTFPYFSGPVATITTCCAFLQYKHQVVKKNTFTVVK